MIQSHLPFILMSQDFAPVLHIKQQHVANAVQYLSLLFIVYILAALWGLPGSIHVKMTRWDLAT